MENKHIVLKNEQIIKKFNKARVKVMTEKPDLKISDENITNEILDYFLSKRRS